MQRPLTKTDADLLYKHPLIYPLVDLPIYPAVGAPVVQLDALWQRGGPSRWVLLSCYPTGARILRCSDGEIQPANLDELGLDLRPPPLGQMDGVHFAGEILARSQGWAFSGVRFASHHVQTLGLSQTPDAARFNPNVHRVNCRGGWYRCGIRVFLDGFKMEEGTPAARIREVLWSASPNDWEAGSMEPRRIHLSGLAKVQTGYTTVHTYTVPEARGWAMRLVLDSVFGPPECPSDPTLVPELGAG